MRVLHAYGNDSNEIPGHQCLDDLPTLILFMCCHTSLQTIVCSHVTSMEGDTLKLIQASPGLCPVHHSSLPTLIHILSL